MVSGGTVPGMDGNRSVGSWCRLEPAATSKDSTPKPSTPKLGLKEQAVGGVGWAALAAVPMHTDIKEAIGCPCTKTPWGCVDDAWTMRRLIYHA